MGITPVIKPRKNGRIRYSRIDGHLYTQRDVHLKEIREYGYDEWKEKYKYGKRWMVETVFSVLKRMNNEVIRSRKLGYMVKELERLVWAYDLIRVNVLMLKNGKRREILIVLELWDKAHELTQ